MGEIFHETEVSSKIRRVFYQLGYTATIPWSAGILYYAADLNIKGVFNLSCITLADYLVSKAVHETQKEIDKEREVIIAQEGSFQLELQGSILQVGESVFLEEPEAHQ